jgi:hypothetical protein
MTRAAMRSMNTRGRESGGWRHFLPFMMYHTVQAMTTSSDNYISEVLFTSFTVRDLYSLKSK